MGAFMINILFALPCWKQSSWRLVQSLPPPPPQPNPTYTTFETKDGENENHETPIY